MKYNKILTKSFLIQEYIDNKKSTNQIAKEIKCSQPTVFYYLKKHRIKTRNLSKSALLLNRKDRNSPSYIDGRTNKKYYCIDCNKEITIESGFYGSGRCKSCSRKGKLNWFRNHNHTKEAKEKIRNSDYHKNLKDKNNPFYGKHHTEETKKEVSLTKGGTGIPYENNNYPEEYFKIRPKILKRDNYICQLCFKYGNEPHHIDYNKNNNDETNLICLCRKCNMKVNKNRDYWQEYFQNKIKEANNA